MADQTNALAGIVTLTIDGTQYQVSGDAKYQVSGVKRETLPTQNKTVHGFKETARAGSISATLRDRGDLSVAKLQAITNSSVVLELSNGKTIVGSRMWNVDDQDVETAEGTVDIKFEGPSVTEA